MDRLTFKKAAPEHQEAVLQWLSEPHIKEFWDNSPEHREDILIFMNGRKEPSPYWNGMFDYWIGFVEDEPYCLLMTSEILPHQTDLPEVWKAYLSRKGKTFSIDFMIGNTKHLGKGLGGKTLESFTEFIQEKIDPTVDTFFIDPAASNPRAKHVYEKGGFETVATFYRDCQDEKNVEHFLMVKKMPEAGFVEVDGFKLRYRIEGEGQTALIVGSAIYYQRSFSKQLREHLRLIFVDWRGFGEMMNSPSGSSLSLDTFIDDIEQVRKKLNIESLIMVGHSAHALLALEYAKKYPKYVSHVVMIGISPNLSPEMAQAAERNWQESVWPERKEVLQARIKELPDEELQKLAPAERFVAWCIRRAPQTWYDYHFNSSLWEGIIPNLSMLDYFYGVALRDLDITKGLENFNKPVLLALGRFDFILAPASVWDPIRSKFQNLTVRIFEHSGHSPHYEEASLFENELLQWIEKKDG